MRPLRPVNAAPPARFGRRPLACSAAAQPSASGLTDDLRLFATCYAAGFLFVAVLIF